MMIYTLMHKNVPVLDMEMSSLGTVEKIEAIYNRDHCPVGVTGYGGLQKTITRSALDLWWGGRSIPASRRGAQQLLKEVNVPTFKALAMKSCGLSLSDQYWIKPQNIHLDWSDINFFDNDFSKDVGDFLFHQIDFPTNLMSPDNTSDGWLPKKWIISDNKRILMKGGSGVYKQEPLNELVACAFMKRLKINHVSYSLTIEENQPYSLCETFITTDTELIPASRVGEIRRIEAHESSLTHLLESCKELGVPDPQDEINKMLVVDYLIVNTDRHFNNFGFIRNANSLEWEGFAPIYDNGTSLWNNSASTKEVQTAKPFVGRRDTHEKQIKMVTDFSWLDLSKLKGISDECYEIFSMSPLLEEKRKVMLCQGIEDRITSLSKVI